MFLQVLNNDLSIFIECVFMSHSVCDEIFLDTLSKDRMQRIQLYYILYYASPWYKLVLISFRVYWRRYAECFTIIPTYTFFWDFKMKVFDLMFSTEFYVLEGTENELSIFRKCLFMSHSTCIWQSFYGLSIFITNATDTIEFRLC